MGFEEKTIRFLAVVFLSVFIVWAIYHAYLLCTFSNDIKQLEQYPPKTEKRAFAPHSFWEKHEYLCDILPN